MKNELKEKMKQGTLVYYPPIVGRAPETGAEKDALRE